MKKVFGVIGLLSSLMLTSCGFSTVETGYVGIKKKWGKVEGEPLGPGFHTHSPIGVSVTDFRIRESALKGKESSYSKDSQTVDVTYTLLFQPDEAFAKQLYVDKGLNWAKKIIPQEVAARIKEVTGKYQAVELITQREKAVADMRKKITESLAKKNVIVTGFELPNLELSDKFENAVEKKVVAIQLAEEAKNNTARIQEESEQKKIRANADAHAMRIKAKALTQSKALVEYEAIKKWNGVMPQTIIGGNGATPFINLNSVKK